MNVVAIVQARCGSTRFPNKIFALLEGKPLIWHIINRLKFSKRIYDILLATTNNPSDDKLEEWAKRNDVKIFRGSENDVLNRFYEGAKKINADIVVRITADDPFKEPGLIDKAIDSLIENQLDFVCNNNPPSFPEGLDVEVLTFDALEKSEKASTSLFEREHVTQYIYHNSNDFKMLNISNDEDISHLRWTIDTDTDFEMAQRVYNDLYISDDDIFHMDDILELIKKKPNIASINSNVKRSAMYTK